MGVINAVHIGQPELNLDVRGNMNDLLMAMLARRQARVDSDASEVVPGPIDENPPFDAFTENLAYHWRRYESAAQAPKKPALRPERLVLAAIIRWLKQVPYFRVKRVSVGSMRTAQGFRMGFGGVKGESDLIITPDKDQPFERQIFVECKRPNVIVDGKKVQRAGKQSEDQLKFQHDVEARGDSYVVVTSVQEMIVHLVSLGFTNLPPYRGR